MSNPRTWTPSGDLFDRPDTPGVEVSWLRGWTWEQAHNRYSHHRFSGHPKRAKFWRRIDNWLWAE